MDNHQPSLICMWTCSQPLGARGGMIWGKYISNHASPGATTCKKSVFRKWPKYCKLTWKCQFVFADPLFFLHNIKTVLQIYLNSTPPIYTFLVETPVRETACPASSEVEVAEPDVDQWLGMAEISEARSLMRSITRWTTNSFAHATRVGQWAKQFSAQCLLNNVNIPKNWLRGHTRVL